MTKYKSKEFNIPPYIDPEIPTEREEWFLDYLFEHTDLKTKEEAKALATTTTTTTEV